MSLHPQPLVPVLEETARVARAAYPKGNLSMRIRDELGTIYEDQAFASLFPHCGQPAESPWRLLLVCLMQFAEGLSDQQAADAVRTHIDWKYALLRRVARGGIPGATRKNKKPTGYATSVPQSNLSTVRDIHQWSLRG